jgi:chromosome partitioning protein
MILAIGGIKGGVGKTTVAVNFAIMGALNGNDVLLVDADIQTTATDFTDLRTEKYGEAGYTSIVLAGQAVKSQTLRMRDKYDHIIIDCGARDTVSQRAALSIADMVLVPFQPRSFDIWTVDHVLTMVEEMLVANDHLKLKVFLNSAFPRGSDNDDALAMLTEKLAENRNGHEKPPFEVLTARLGDRKAFSNAAAEGLAVIELKPADPKANDEMQDLYRSVMGVAVKMDRDRVRDISGQAISV